MFKKRNSSLYSQSYYGRGKKKKISLVWVGLSIPLILILLELLARLIVNMTGKDADLKAYQGQPANVSAYRLKFLTQDQKPIEGLISAGDLLAQRSAGVSYQLVGNQESAFWKINEQGFRDSEALSVIKPKNEIRVFILGDSTAFGQGNPNNETISEYLEARLKTRVNQQKQSPNTYQPDILPYYWFDRDKALRLTPKIIAADYRVINAAIPGYTSGNQLAQLALQILPYKPDAIVVIGGYGDLFLPSDTPQRDIPKVDQFLANAQGHYFTYLNNSFQQWLNSTYLVKSVNYFILKPQPSLKENFAGVDSLEQSLPQKPEELDKRVARYFDHQKQMVTLAASAKIPLFIVIQPEITGLPPKKVSQNEQAIKDSLGEKYLTQIAKDYPKFVAASQRLEKTFPNQIKVLNLGKLDNNFPSNVFTDAVHLTKDANSAIADKLYSTITQDKSLQFKPVDPRAKKQ